MTRLVKSISGVLRRAGTDPAREYRRLRLRFHLSPVLEPLPEGVGVYIYSGEIISSRLHARDFELAPRRLLRDVLKPGMTFIDAGANLGIYTAIAAKFVGPLGRVYGFEPSRREWARALRTVKVNRLKNVELYPAALGECDGSVSLTVCENECAAFNSLGTVTHGSARGHESHVEQVPCRALDSFVAEKAPGQVDVVKIDVEGAEARVLNGGRRMFSRADGPIVICELSDWTAHGVGSSAAEVWDLLSEFGYTMYTIHDDARGYRLSLCERKSRVEYMEVLAVKSGHRERFGRELQIPF
jgi:FkbM family methyltransferase